MVRRYDPDDCRVDDAGGTEVSDSDDDSDETRADDDSPVPSDRGVIERLERCGGVFDYEDRLTVRVGRSDGGYDYAVAEGETLADAADSLRDWGDGRPEIETGRFVGLFDTGTTDEDANKTDADTGRIDEDADEIDEETGEIDAGREVDADADRQPAETDPDGTTDSLHPIPTRVRVFNGDTGTRHFDNGATPPPPVWSDEASAKADYQRNLRLFADPEAGTFRCYLNVNRRGPEQVIADVSVDEAPKEPFLTYCAQAIRREIRNRGWELYETDEQVVFDTLRGATTVDPRWPYDDRETELLQQTTPVSVVAPTQRAAVGVVAAVREWPGESSLSVAGGDGDGATGAAAIRVGYTPRVSAVTATGEAARRLAVVRRERARETVDETLAALADAVAGERLPNVRAAAWLNDTLRGSDEDEIDRGATSRRTQFRSRGPVSLSRSRLRRRLERLLPVASVCLTLVVVTFVVLFTDPTAALATVGREVTATGTPVVATVASGGSAPVWQLLVATLLPPAVTLVVTRPTAVRRQVSAARDATAWLTTRRGPETTVDVSGTDLVAAVETATRGDETPPAADESVSDAAAFLDERLVASALELTTQSPPESDVVLSRHTVVAVLLAVGLTLSVFAVPLAGALGWFDAVAPFLSLAAVASLPVSWLAAVVALWRS